MTPTQSDFIPQREREYKLFLVWQILPQTVRELGTEYLDQEGITDDLIREVAGIKTQKQFAKQFGLSPDTLTDWKQHPVPEQYKDLYDTKYYSKNLIKNVEDLLYRGMKQHKDAARAKVLFEYHGKYTTKSEVQVSGTVELFDNIKQILENTKGES